MNHPITEVRDDFTDTATLEKTNSAGGEIVLSFLNTAILQRLKSDGEKDVIDTPLDNVVYDYLPEIERASMIVELTDDEYEKYKYRPDLMSYDLYGTTTYEFILLAINQIISPKYFTKKKYKIVDSDFIEELISDIYNSEHEYLTLNRSNYDKEDTIVVDETLKTLESSS